MIATLLAAAAAASPTHAAAGPATEVSIPGQRFTPPRATVLVGEEVVWRNLDSARHTVTAEDRSFDSGGIHGGGEFRRRFDTAGSYRYRCTIHRIMRGTVEVASLALEGPDAPVRPGASVTLEGRGPEGMGAVTLERGGAAVASTRADPDGRFRFSVVADSPAAYRARAGELSSGAVAVPIAPFVRLSARRQGRAVKVSIVTDPPQPGARVVLERHVRERFGFVRMRGLTLDGMSSAGADLRTARRLRLRARLAIPVGGYSRSIGNVVVVPRRGSTGSGGGHH